jgi:hypothetical protein
MRPCIQFSLLGLRHLSDSYRLVRLSLLLDGMHHGHAPASSRQLGRLCLDLTADQLVLQPFNLGRHDSDGR